MCGTPLRKGAPEEENIVHRIVLSSTGDATQAGRPPFLEGGWNWERHHAYKGHHLRHVLRSWRSWDQMARTTVRVEDLQGRTDIVHNHFKELFADPRHEEAPEWRWQRWPQEVLSSLPTIDSQRVTEAAYAFRKRTSCADDHLVIEMLVGNTRKVLSGQIAGPLDGR